MKLRHDVGEFDCPDNEDDKIQTLNIMLYWPIATDKDLKITIVGLSKSMASKRGKPKNRN